MEVTDDEKKALNPTHPRLYVSSVDLFERDLSLAGLGRVALKGWSGDVQVIPSVSAPPTGAR
jgi:hypothetical protein